MADWFSSLATQASQYVDSVVDSIAAQANEAQAEMIAEQRKLKEENERLGWGTTDEKKKKSIKSEDMMLPWETSDEDKTILTQELMEKILNLSLVEENFTTSSPNNSDIIARGEWNFVKFIPRAMRLMEIDSNLKRMHAKVCPKMNDEELFWLNYFCRMQFLRASSGIEGSLAQQTSLKWKESDIIAIKPESTKEEMKISRAPFLFGTALKDDTNLSGSSENILHDGREAYSVSSGGNHENDSSPNGSVSKYSSPAKSNPNSNSNSNSNPTDVYSSSNSMTSTSSESNVNATRQGQGQGQGQGDVDDVRRAQAIEEHKLLPTSADNDVDVDVDDDDNDNDDLDLDLNVIDLDDEGNVDDIDDDDDLDLADLDDLDIGDMSSYENIDADEDFELEAAIARELAADND